MAENQHSLFFKAKDLTGSDEELIRTHFQAPLEKVGDDNYKITFNKQEEQERVLQKKFHTVPHSKGELTIIVSRTLTSGVPSTTKPKPLPKPKLEAMEKRLPLKLFYLRFLTDSSKAFESLQNQLSSVGCTGTIDLDKEELVVKSVQPRSEIGGAENWEQKVDMVVKSNIERYSSYFVTDLRQIKNLLRDQSLLMDDLYVYVENGRAVLVGKVEAVKARVEILEQSLPPRKVLQIMEKRYQLVKADFCQEMLAHHPSVKINRSSDMITLEGSDTDVQEGAAKLDKWIKKIQEKRLLLAPAVIDFLTSSGAIQQYKTCFEHSLRKPVSMEVESEVILSSLSQDAMDEAEALLKDLKVVLHTVEHSITDLKNLNDILMKATDEANRTKPNVEVNFIPGLSAPGTTDILFVGNDKSVKNLKEILQEYLSSQNPTKEVVSLPIPDLVECFKEFQHLIDLNLTSVTLETTSSPNPRVLISGPSSEVKKVKHILTSAFEKLISGTLLLDGLGALRYFQANGRISKELVENSFQVIIREQQEGQKPKPAETKIKRAPNLRERSKSDEADHKSKQFWKNHFLHSIKTKRKGNKPGVAAVNKTSLKIKLGSLEDEQVHVLVAPMLDTKLTSTRIGSCLLDKAGNGLKEKFDSLASKGFISPGEVLQVDGPPNLNCSKLIFIRCLPWDGKNGSKSLKALKRGLQQCLNLCEEEQWNSVSLPIIGPGIVLNIPLVDAVKALTETIHQFKSFHSLTDINIIVKPGNPGSAQSYNLVQEQLSLFLNKQRTGSFGSLTTDLDSAIITLEGGIKLELVFGDITNEETDAVVNSTDFRSYDYEGVCKYILAKAGPEVKAELKQATNQRGEIFKSQPGNFPGKAILHVCGFKSASLVEKLSADIIDYCENFQYKSVAIPAICAGVGGLAPDVAAKAILQGIRTVTSYRNLKVVNNIRIVLYTIHTFLAFKKEAEQIFFSDDLSFQNGSGVLPRTGQPTLAPPLVKRLSFPPCEDQQSKFLILGLSRESVNNAQIKLKDLYEAQCYKQSFTAEQLNSLMGDDEKRLKDLIPSHGLCMKYDSSGSLTVSGLKDGVNQALIIIQNSHHNQLKFKMREREEQELYEHVAWCIMGKDGQWVRLPPTANYRLEKPDSENSIIDAEGITWIANLQEMTVMTPLSRKRRTLKRLDIEPDFTFPLYWDNMKKGESTKTVQLLPSTAEYQKVKGAFLQTQTSTIIKIERLQNIPLRRAYEVQKKNLSNKSGDNEKLLYHGTTSENINGIITNGFNRRYAGQNATSYGLGTYFAIDARYSANPKYSKPAANGHQSMFVARVLTGVYVLGHVDMKVLPPRDPQRPQDLYDSAVDNLENPQMFVVFQDNQACPDYLITFK